jgi:hypothetical protein
MRSNFFLYRTSSKIKYFSNLGIYGYKKRWDNNKSFSNPILLLRLDLGSEIRDPRSEIRDPRSEIRDPRSGIQDQGSVIEKNQDPQHLHNHPPVHLTLSTPGSLSEETLTMP